MNDYSKLKGHKTYHKVYAAYVKDAPSKLLTDAGVPVQGKRVLDLCCGRGDLAIWAKTNGATEVTAVDACGSMMDKTALTKAGVGYTTSAVVYALRRFGAQRFDLIACRQAVNYWLADISEGEAVAQVLPPGGQFVFNTFNHSPGPQPKVTADYELNDRHYLEVSYCRAIPRGYWGSELGLEVVSHLQCCEGEIPHETQFYWIPEKAFHEILDRWFDTRVINRGRGSTWVCTKK